MRTILGVFLIILSATQIATASERHIRKVYNQLDLRGSYNQLNETYYQTRERRDIENYGFSFRDPSRVGGWDPSVTPSD